MYALQNRPSFSMLVKGTQKSKVSSIFFWKNSLRLPKVRKLENKFVLYFVQVKRGCCNLASREHDAHDLADASEDVRVPGDNYWSFFLFQYYDFDWLKF